MSRGFIDRFSVLVYRESFTLVSGTINHMADASSILSTCADSAASGLSTSCLLWAGGPHLIVVGTLLIESAFEHFLLMGGTLLLRAGTVY